MPRTIFSYRSRPQGFALIIALALMAFIMLLLLSLSSLTRIEVTTSTVHRSMLEAKKNAELGLVVALGNLQRLAGPDQRVTASAALLDENIVGTRYWTGVWDASSWNPQNPDEHRFLGWLVSGNQTELGLKDAYRGSTDDMVQLLGEDSSEAYSVVVPEVGLREGGASSANTGSYAYWISDESQKAKVNLEDSYRRQKQTDVAAEKARISLPHAFGLEMDGRLEGADVWNPDNYGRWKRVYSLSALPLHDGAFSPLLGSADNVSETFHSYTTEGYGLLADAQHGGLRKNLTWGLNHEQTFNSTLGSKRVLEQNEVKPAWLTGGANFFTPRWETLRDYARLPETFSGLKNRTFTIDSRARGLANDEDAISGYYLSEPDGVGKLAARLSPGNTVPALEPLNSDIEPLLTRLSFFFRTSTEEDVDDFYKVNLDVIPRFTLWNPYNVAMRLSGTYIMQVQLKPTFTMTKLGEADPFFSGTLRNMSGAQRDYLWLQVDMDKLPLQDRILAPGALRVFGLQSISKVRTTGASGRIRIYADLAPYHAEQAGIRFDATPTAVGGTQIKRGDEITISWETDSEFRNPNPAITSYLRLSKNEANGTRYLLQNVDGFGLDQVGTVDPETWLVSGDNSLEDIPLEMGGYDLHLKHAGEGAAGVPVVASFNPRAYYSTLLAEDYAGGRPPNWSVETLDYRPIYLDYEDTPYGYMLRGEWGSGLDGGGRRNVVLYELPQSFPQSLAEFRHANLSHFANLPAHAIGNSWANPHLDARYVAGKSGGKTQMDFPWLLNTALWDRYFLTSYPTDNSAAAVVTRLPNSRLFPLSGSVTRAELESYDDIAALLAIDGAFNVNSTSEKAWAALLGSLKAPNADAYNPLNGSSSTVDFDRSFFRFTRLLTGTSSHHPDWYQGHWKLSEDDINALAREMVSEVRARGPFMHLADFVNRRLVNDATGRVGALQAAIDSSGVNDGFTGDYNLSDADANFPHADNAPQAQAAGMTGHLSQADVLAALGSVITTRGDTFRIIVRGQGPAVTNGQEPSTAWLQAVVQRMPEYMDTVDSPQAEPSALVSEINRQLGRRFRVVQFEWLNSPPL